MNEFVVEDTVSYVSIDKVAKDFSLALDVNKALKKITITAGGKCIELKLGESIGYLNKLEVSLQKPPKIIDGHIYIPLTFLSDVLGLEVSVRDNKINILEEKEKNISRTDKLIFFNEDLMKASKNELQKGVDSYVDAFNKIQADTQEFMKAPLNPVTNKTLIPPSGDKHDYMTTAPYFWPDLEKVDGLPWKPKDGQINPASRGDDTDFSRTNQMFLGIESLCLSYYFTKDSKYIKKAYEVIKVWFIDDETKVTPYIKYGQSVPGGIEGRPLGVIEWAAIVNVVTALQMLEREDMISQEDIDSMLDWFRAYSSWLRRSKIGIDEKEQHNNHGSNYDYPLAGILLYINNYNDAVEVIEEAKVERIEDFVDLDGCLPFELRRTKSVNYHNTCLWPLIQLADIGKRFTDVDLWNHRSLNGASFKKAFGILAPYAKNETKWKWEQIVDSAQIRMAKMIRPLFLKTNNLFGCDIDGILEQPIIMPYVDILKYNIPGNDKGILSATYIVKTTVNESLIRLNWMIQERGIRKFIIHRKKSKNGRYSILSKIESSNIDEYLDQENLEYGCTYYYRIQAFDEDNRMISELESIACHYSSKWIDFEEELLSASDGERFTLDLYRCEKVPPFVFNAIMGRNIEFLINTESKILGGGASWSMCGTSIERKVTTNMIFDVCNKLSISPNKRLSEAPQEAKAVFKLGRVHITPLGFPIKLNIDLGKEYCNDSATLYTFGSEELVEVNSKVKISQDGCVVFDMVDEPDYVIAIH